MHHSLHALLFNILLRSSSGNPPGRSSSPFADQSGDTHHMMNVVDSMHHVLYT